MGDLGPARRWSPMAARIAFSQAAISLAFFGFLLLYSMEVYHGIDHLTLPRLLGASTFVIGVPAAFVVVGLGFRSGALWPTLLGVALEGVWFAFAVWAMASQAAAHDWDFLNNLPVYTLLAGAALAAATLPFLDPLPPGKPRGGASLRPL